MVLVRRKDPNNPMGRFELPTSSKGKHWADSSGISEAKHLAASVKGPMYIDPRGNAYEIDGVREEVGKAMTGAKLNARREK
jgi:hypothetical protein